jgi:hypothetical protein
MIVPLAPLNLLATDFLSVQEVTPEATSSPRTCFSNDAASVAVPRGLAIPCLPRTAFSVLPPGTPL